MDKVAKVFMNYGIDEAYKAPSILMNILFDKGLREKLFKDLLIAHDYDLSYDWFFEYFQDEHADRKKKKQDFTPRCVAELLSRIALTGEGDPGNYYECCAGTGSIMITHWDNHRRGYSPFAYRPSQHFAHLEELSDRTVPFLLLNMMVRGMNGVVVHGDTLRRTCKSAYLVCNTEDDHMDYSGISVFPHTEEVEKLLNVKFIGEQALEHKELMSIEKVDELLRGCNDDSN